MIFQDRVQAGEKLAGRLTGYRDGDVVVYALPRGGVVVGVEVAKQLKAPLDLIIARKIGHPFSPEYAIGAVTETGEPVWNDSEISSTTVDWQRHQVQLARSEAKRRRLEYSGGKKSISPEGKTVIIVDDGIATGLTMIAALKELRSKNPKTIVVAVPVAPRGVAIKLAGLADRTIILHIPKGNFWAVGNYYLNFNQVDDEEVKLLMGQLVDGRSNPNKAEAKKA